MGDQDRISLYNNYQHNIKQTSNEKKEKSSLGDYWLIQYQILQTNITRTIWQTVRRITNEILGVKGLMRVHSKIKQAATRSAAIGFSFKSDWLRKLTECSEPITAKRN